MFAATIYRHKWLSCTAPANFLRFLNDVVRASPERELHMILDNLNIHKNEAARRWLEWHPRAHSHYTPTHASWVNVNIVEVFFSILGKQGLSQRVNTIAFRITELNRKTLALSGWRKVGSPVSPHVRWRRSYDANKFKLCCLLK